MKTTLKRLLSTMLILCMIVSLMPMGVLADTADPIAISDENVTVGACPKCGDNCVYNGNGDHKRSVSVAISDGTELVKDQDYTVAYSSITDAGDNATITITGIGSYTGEVVKKFSIAPAEREVTITLPTTEAEYNGNELTLTADEINAKMVVEGISKPIEYTGSGLKITSVGSKSVSASDFRLKESDDRRNYSLDITVEGGTVEITPKPLNIEVEINSGVDKVVDWNGSERTLMVEGNYTYTCETEHDVLIYNGSDITGIAAGTYEADPDDFALARTNEYHKNYKIETISIVGKLVIEEVPSIADADVELGACTECGKTVCVYNGDKHRPAVTVTYEGTVLTEGVDYSVAYAVDTNANVNKSTVTVTGMGNYIGSQTKNFSIDKATLALTVTVRTKTAEYSGAALELTKEEIAAGFTYDSSKTNLIVYTGSGISRTEAGTASVSAADFQLTSHNDYDDNYELKVTVEGGTVTVYHYVIEDDDVVAAASKEYNGEAQYAGVYVDVTLDGVATRLTKDKDFTVQYTQGGVEINPTQPGTYYVTVKGIGNYTGTVVKQFEIKPAAVNVTYAFTPATGLPAGVTDQLPAATVIYTGDAVELPNMTKVDVKGGAWYFEGWTVTGAVGDDKEYTVGTTDVTVTGAWKFYPGDISIEITKNIKVEAPEKPDKPEKPGKPTRPEIDKDHWRISFIDKNELGYNANPASDNYWGWDKKFDDKCPDGGEPDGKPEIIRPTIRETFTFKLYTVETNRFGKVVKTDLLQTITFYYDAKALTQTREFVLNAKAEAALKDGKNVFIAEVDDGDSSWDYDNAVYVLSYADGEVKAKRSVTGAVDLSLNYVDVEFTNEYLGEEEDEDDYEDGAVVKLTLVDSKDSDEVISGAKFYLYKEGRNSDVKIGGTYYTTNVKGQIIVRGLDEGDYYFVQSTTKTGYEKVEERIEFEVEDEDDYIKITVENAKEGCPSEYFYDLNTGMWYHEAVDFVLDKGLMNGVGGKYFDPHGTINRAMVVTILWRLEGQPYVAGNMSFKDVGSGLWYTEAVRWAAANGIVTGHDAATFAPLESITHEQMAAILYRYAQFKGKSVNTAAGAGVMNFSDANQISAWALDAMKWAYGEGIVGYMGTTLDPKGPAQRCEAAKMLMEYLK